MRHIYMQTEGKEIINLLTEMLSLYSERQIK